MVKQEYLAALSNDMQQLVRETCDKIEVLSYPPDSPYYGKAFIAHQYDEEIAPEIYPLVTLIFGAERIGTLNKQHYRLGLLGTWHILRNAKSICSYVGGLDSDGKLLQHIQLLENHQVKRVVFIEKKFNLFLEFDHNFWLGIFHADNLSSGFKFSYAKGYGTGASGTYFTLCNGDLLFNWWIS